MTSYFESKSDPEHQFDGMTEPYNLKIGAPGPDALAKMNSIFEPAVSQFMKDSKENGFSPIFQYGPEQGNRPFVNELSKFLTQEYSSPVSPNDLIMTGGATTGMWLLASSLLMPARGVIFVESPTYFIILDILQGMLGHKIVRVPMDRTHDGVDVEALEAKVKEEYAKVDKSEITEGKFWAMYYTIPTFHNPTGQVLSPQKAEKICELSRKFEMLVGCDDVYNLLFYGESSPKRLLAFQENPESGLVISNGTFSKILSPGHRIGWIETRNQKIRQTIINCGVLQSSGAMNNLMGGLIAAGLKNGSIGKYVKDLRAEYAERMSEVHDILSKRVPEGFRVLKPGGGYFIWVSGPACFDADLFAGFAAKQNIKFVTSSMCSEYKNGMRLSIAFYELKALKDGVNKFCDLLDEFTG